MSTDMDATGETASSDYQLMAFVWVCSQLYGRCTVRSEMYYPTFEGTKESIRLNHYSTKTPGHCQTNKILLSAFVLRIDNKNRGC